MIGTFGTANGLEVVIFRYLNVAAAYPEGEIGEDHRPETHLVPFLLEAAVGLRPSLPPWHGLSPLTATASANMST